MVALLCFPVFLFLSCFCSFFLWKRELKHRRVEASVDANDSVAPPVRKSRKGNNLPFLRAFLLSFDFPFFSYRV